MCRSELTMHLMQDVVGIAPTNAVATSEGGAHFGAAAYRMSPMNRQPLFTAGLHLRMERELDKSDNLRADIFQNVPMEMVDTLRFEQGARLLVFGNLLLDVHRALRKQPGYVLASTPGRIVSVRGCEATDEHGERYSFMLRR